MVYWASQGKHMFDGLAGKHHPAIIQREAGMWRERAAQAEQQAQSAATARAPHRRRTTRKQPEPLTLTLDEARGLALLAQGLEQVAGATDFSPSFPIRARGIQARDTISDAPAQVRGRPPDATTAVPSCVPADQPITLADLSALIERLGVVQVDTISVVERSQYLVLWSRLGAYENRLLDQLLSPARGIFEYWSHAASIVPMSDYPYYRRSMVDKRAHIWDSDWASLVTWMDANPDVVQRTLAAIRDRGPLASADFERPADGRRASAWDWYGPKESRRALDVLWTLGDLMIASRRGGQKLYDLRERVLAEAFGDDIPRDDALPTPEEQLRHFALRTVHALGVLLPSWLWDYFRLSDSHRSLAHAMGATVGASAPRSPAKRASAQTLLDGFAREGIVVPARIAGFDEPAYLASGRLADLDHLRAGWTPQRTTLLSPFDNLIWDRARARTLFGYEVCFEAYVLPEKRRYGYYCLAILHQGKLVGRLDPKMDRRERRLIVRAVYLEPGVVLDDTLLDGLAGTLRDLARFLGGEAVTIERSDPAALAPALGERLATL